MPTGFTSFIENGKVKTGNDFLKLCLRNFGVFVNLRDTPLSPDIPTKITGNNDYYEAELAKYKMMKKGLEGFSTKQWYEQQQRDIQSYEAKNKQVKEKFKADTDAYNKIKAEIESWKNDSEFDDVKKFALNQIEISYPKELNYDKEISELKKMTSEDYKKQRLDEVDQMIKAATERIEQENKLVKERQEFLDKFLTSLN